MDRPLRELLRIFRSTPDKRRAHDLSSQILKDVAGDPSCLTWALRSKITSTSASLCSGNYPVVSLPLDSNPWFDLVLNCWIPLPDCSTDISTKAIHHHGTMLLTTVTAFGPGYHHMTFTHPQMVDPDRELFSMKLIESAPHPEQHLAFVDSYIAHVPLYVPSLTITLALWSSQDPTSWRDHLKRVPLLQKNRERLKQMALNTGLSKQLAIKVVDYFDFYPTEEGFRGMKDRKEFPLGPNEDFLQSFFYVLQRTGNDDLAELIEDSAGRQSIPNPARFEGLMAQLQSGDPIEGKLSADHFGVSYANFSKSQIEAALTISPTNMSQ